MICISGICFYCRYCVYNKRFMDFIFACLWKGWVVLVVFGFVLGCLLIGLDETHYRQVYESWGFEAEFRGELLFSVMKFRCVLLEHLMAILMICMCLRVKENSLKTNFIGGRILLLTFASQWVMMTQMSRTKFLTTEV